MLRIYLFIENYINYQGKNHGKITNQESLQITPHINLYNNHTFVHRKIKKVRTFTQEKRCCTLSSCLRTADDSRLSETTRKAGEFCRSPIWTTGERRSGKFQTPPIAITAPRQCQTGRRSSCTSIVCCRGTTATTTVAAVGSC